MKRTILSGLSTFALMAASSFAQDAAPANGQVYEQKQANQKERIDNGVATGKLSTHQAKKLDKNQAKINHEVGKDMAKNGGTLTPGEKTKVAGQMHKESKDIAKKKQVDPQGPAAQ